MNITKTDDRQFSTSLVSTSPKGRRIAWIVGAVFAATAVATALAGPVMSNVEQARFVIVERAGSIELRAYAPTITAETVVQGERKPSIEEGFRRIAGYIFGANTSQTKVAMTAPVTQQMSGEKGWTVSFVMPSGSTMEILPTPNDDRVILKPQPSTRRVAITFSGSATDQLIQMKEQELRNYAIEHGLLISGEPVLAFYNPPWTLPMFRHNEIMFELVDSPGK